MKTEHIILIGVIAGVISAMLPSIPTQYWMWQEREEYRWILILMWIITAFLILYILLNLS